MLKCQSFVTLNPLIWYCRPHCSAGSPGHGGNFLLKIHDMCYMIWFVSHTPIDKYMAWKIMAWHHTCDKSLLSQWWPSLKPWVAMIIQPIGTLFVSKIKTILSIIFIFTIWGCVSSAYTIILWWSRECVLYLIIIIKPEVWIINHCLGLGHETMVCAVCLTMFLWICDMTRLLRGTFHVLVVFAPNLVLCHLACSITILLGTLLMSDT